MFARAVRLLLASSLALVLWTFARPALAMPAPFCDDRGASGIAPAPPLEASDVAVRRAGTAPACPGEDLPLGVSVTRGRAPTAPALLLADPILPTTHAPLVAPSGSRLDPPPPADSPQDGERSRVERPPRG